MADLSPTVSSISSALIGEAAKIGGNLWIDIEKASRFYVKAYAQALIDTARAVAAGEMTSGEGVNSAKAASFFFYMMIAQVTQQTLVAVQRFFDAVINALKVSINGALPFPIL
ncbi:hypothetical protein LB545_29975 [Mesorhizobium sp. BR1-1-6]|uniref:hypothetical protein n=1 Tax=Mesorhizobium sp. BR1-1-6 TaxID=2876648 RepID=UPI001CD0D2E1|nr:hypothetical protein [Mesorhizobium sp. BR1-1-6]MBZ9898541.1 hypothetical protein [Mesorhizobium sp. BR1-1-6]